MIDIKVILTKKIVPNPMMKNKRHFFCDEDNVENFHIMTVIFLSIIDEIYAYKKPQDDRVAIIVL